MGVAKPCPRCGKLIPWGTAYCEACKPIAEQERIEKQQHKAECMARKYNRAYNQRRMADDPKYRQFRNSKEWKTLSKAKLQDCGYLCEAGLDGCRGTACEVHHKIPIKTPDGWAGRFDWNNLMGVCIACHNKLDDKGFHAKKDSGVIDLRTVAGCGGG